MGAWGPTSFQNDSALDWLGDLTDGDASLVAKALAAVGDAEADGCVHVDEACAALAAAELVAAACGKGDDRLNEGAASWLASNRAVVQALGVEPARSAIERVLQGSQLRELWDENGDDTEWHRDVRELLVRLA